MSSLARPEAAIGERTVGEIFTVPARAYGTLQVLDGKFQRLDEIGVSAPVGQFVRDLESKKLAHVVTAAKLYEMKRHTVRLKDKADCLALNEKFHFEES